MRPFEPISWEELPKSAQAILPQDAPPTTRMMAARSLLPMGTRELVNILYFLSADEDRRIRRSARRSLSELPDDMVSLALREELSPKILHWFANRDLSPELAEIIALNKFTENETVALLAANNKNQRLLDIIASNQERLMRSPEIIAALMNNQMTPLEIRERVRSFVEMALNMTVEEIIQSTQVEEEPQAEAVDEMVDESAEAIPDEVMKEGDLLEEGEDLEHIPEDELPADFDLDQLQKEIFGEEDDFTVEFMVDPEQELSGSQRQTLANRIRKLRVLDKMRLALKGNIEARQILIKSSNKLIQECVLRNPRVTIEEIIRMSKDKTMREELIRMIAVNKEWTKNYQVVNQLCWNPKTPITHALKFLNRLNIKEVQSIAKSKQVPGMLAVAARKVVDQKQKYR